jgi:hypothetical protein
MERKIIALAVMAGLQLFAWLWGWWCARHSVRRGWDGQKAGRMSLLCVLIAAPVLVLAGWRFFPAFPLMMTLARWSCFRVLRPGERFADLEEQYPAFDHKPITLNLNQMDRPEESR